MTYSELEPEIRRLYRVEKWPVGTIARELAIHHSVVSRVISSETGDKVKAHRDSILDPYVGFVQQTLEKYPRIKASRLFIMLRERGYPGRSDGHVRSLLKRLRPHKSKEAFFRLTCLPGEQAQVDWAHFGKFQTTPTCQRNLSAFVMTLAHSRMIFLRFFLSSKSRDFYQGFAEAFEFFGGVPKQVWMDNLRSGVTSRVGPLVQFNERMLALASHFTFEPVAMGVRRGNEKGKVERSIQYVRSSFFEAHECKSLKGLNEKALDWCLQVAGKRRWQDDPSKTVYECFMQEKERLLPLPNARWSPAERTLVNVPKVPFVRFDLNSYSVPWAHAQSQVMLEFDDQFVKVIKNNDVIVEHERSYGRGELVEISDHFDGLAEVKAKSRKHAGLSRLKSAVPVAEEFLQILSERGENIGSIVSRLLHLLDLYGRKNLAAAIEEVVVHETPRLRSLHFVLKRLDQAHGNVVPIVPDLGLGKAAAVTVEYHTPQHYDHITGMKKNES